MDAEASQSHSQESIRELSVYKNYLSNRRKVIINKGKYVERGIYTEERIINLLECAKASYNMFTCPRHIIKEYLDVEHPEADPRKIDILRGIYNSDIRIVTLSLTHLISLEEVAKISLE